MRLGLRAYIAAALAVIGIIAALAVSSLGQPQTGTVHISYNTNTLPNSAITFNGKSYPAAGNVNQTVTYNLPHGNYSLAIRLAGYKSFSTSFSLATGSTIVVTAHLSLSSDPTIHDLGQITGLTNSALIVQSINYYYNQTWTTITVQASATDTDTAVIVASYTPATASWQLRLGPGTYFQNSDISNLPQQVQNYLQANNYVNSGGP